MAFRGSIAFLLTLGIVQSSSHLEAATVEGTVRWEGQDIPVAEPIIPTTDSWLCEKANLKKRELVVEPRTRGIRWAALWLEPLNKAALPPKPAQTHQVTLDNKRCAFEPHMLIVQPGATLNLTNSDPLLHNAHLLPHASQHGKGGDSFNIALLPKDKGRKKKVEDRGVYSVSCDVHTWMKAWVVVQPHQGSTITDSNGEFRFTGIAPGSYILHLWHETLGTRKKEIAVDHKGLSKLQFNLKSPSPAAEK